MGQADDVPGAAGVVATIDPATTGVQSPAAGIEPLGITRIDDDVGDDIILTGTDTAQKLPMCALIGGVFRSRSEPDRAPR